MELVGKGSFCVPLPSGCRMSAKSTFLVMDMKSKCKHIPKVGDKHWYFIQQCIKWVKNWIMYISAKFFNWHFKRNILGKMLVFGNRCHNLCPEECVLSQIPIAC